MILAVNLCLIGSVAVLMCSFSGDARNDVRGLSIAVVLLWVAFVVHRAGLQ